MIYKDYLLRLIEQITLILARVLKLQFQGQYEVALRVIDQAMRDFLGLSSEFVDSFSAEELFVMLQSASGFETGKALILAEFIRAEGDVFHAEGKIDLAAARYTKALRFYLEIYSIEGKEFLGERSSKLDEVLTYLQDYVLPQPLNLKLFEYCQREQQTSHAFRVFGDLLDQSPDSELIQTGLLFHRELARSSDETLRQLELSRSAVTERITMLKKFKPHQAGKGGAKPGSARK